MYRIHPAMHPLFWVFVLFLMIIIAFFVVKDANKRGLNGLLWGIAVVILPVFGLIIYLIVSSFSTNNLRQEKNYSQKSDFTTPQQSTTKSYTVPVNSDSNNSDIKELKKNTQYCTNCGYENNFEATYCNSCGTKLP